VLEEQLRMQPREARAQFVDDIAARTGVDVELFDSEDIAVSDAHFMLQASGYAFMSASDGRTWMLKRVADDGRVLAVRYAQPVERRGALEWVIAGIFYAAIALVLMLWLWPLTRDLRALERSTASFGNRNWRFDAHVSPRSPVHSLAVTFRRMADRIDQLIAAQKDMSNAVAHEVRTPLARMRFEAEMARTQEDRDQVARHLANINTDIEELDAFVNATLDYAILERAEVALNLAEHDFVVILPAVADAVRRSTRNDLSIECVVDPGATRIRCDIHLMETSLRNLLYNAARYARAKIQVRFGMESDGAYRLCVDDDGPGVPEADRERVFGSFVQLREPGTPKVGYGLGLAIVKRIAEWHGGTAAVATSPLGGASFEIRWMK
jgi:signal transduction histidine kinase